MEQEATYVGIDCWHRRCQIPGGRGGSPRRRRLACRYESGIASLMARLQSLNPTTMLLQATGGMKVPLVAALAAASLPVVVVNPRQVRDFAKATGRLARTDALYARVWPSLLRRSARLCAPWL